MAVRGTSVARHQKYIWVMNEADQGFEGDRIWCAWSDCDKYAYSLHQFIVNEAKPGFPPKLARYAFCSEQCRHYFARSHIPGEYGKLRGEYRSRFL